MCRLAIFVVVATFFHTHLEAGEPKDKKVELKKAIDSADLIVVGKVTKTGLVAASSFDVGEIEASKVLLGDDKIKTAQFRIPGRMTPDYAKVGVEGIWILDKASKPGWRNVLSYLPATEEEAIRAVLKATK